MSATHDLWTQLHNTDCATCRRWAVQLTAVRGDLRDAGRKAARSHGINDNYWIAEITARKRQVESARRLAEQHLTEHRHVAQVAS